MKKIAFLSILAGLFMVGCTEMAQPADPQSNPQEELVTITGAVTATAVPTIDLAKVEGDSVKVVNVTTEITAPEGTELKYYLTLNETVEYEVPADTVIVLPVAELQALVEEVYGKRPVERKISAVVTVAAVVRGSAVLYKSEKFDIAVIPAAPFIDSAYYLVGDMCGWDAASARKFNHSGKDVYEDPVFTLVIKVPDTDGNGADYWKIIPAGNYDNADRFWTEGVTGVVGVEVDGDDATEGKLVTTAPQAAKINFNTDEKSMNLYKITLNMMDYTYKVEELNFVEYIYAPGNHQGWSPATAPALHGPSFEGVWTGYSMLDGGFKFVQERAWAAEYKGSDFTTLPDGFTTDGGDIIAGKKAFYYIKADVSNAKLEATEINSFGVIGSAVAPYDWSADVDMTWDPEKLAFVITGLELKDGVIKFRANDGWDINAGGSFDDLADNGPDIAVTAGTYDIELYLQRTPESNEKMTAKVTKK